MENRFDRTQREARAAIERAKARHELEVRIAELEDPQPPHRPNAGRGRLTQARDRVTRAETSSARARQRADEAFARREFG